MAAKVPGASDMQTFRFFTNDFDTTTDGIDVVATYSTELMVELLTLLLFITKLILKLIDQPSLVLQE
ncbi:MAG: hypothetical protein CM15mP86_04690 [Gammaproteobacteria bacterium]|nr:MAG: hypothetical protein CM15mP86_04690 [Gammaproteobacteria bacterium]